MTPAHLNEAYGSCPGRTRLRIVRLFFSLSLVSLLLMKTAIAEIELEITEESMRGIGAGVRMERPL